MKEKKELQVLEVLWNLDCFEMLTRDWGLYPVLVGVLRGWNFTCWCPFSFGAGKAVYFTGNTCLQALIIPHALLQTSAFQKPSTKRFFTAV